MHLNKGKYFQFGSYAKYNSLLYEGTHLKQKDSERLKLAS